MKTVTLGTTGLEVTQIGYDTWPFGGDLGPVDELAAVAAISHARSLGINFFGTAHAYGFGRAERVLGRALADELRSARDSVVIAAKGGVRMDASLLPYAQAHDIGVLVYGPPGHGLLGFRRSLAVLAVLRRFAADRGATIAQLAVAWLLAHPPVHVAIIGSRTAAHLEESLGALDLTLSHADMAEIDSIMAACQSAAPTRKA